MSDTRKSFVFYSDWYDAICGLDDATALEVSKAIMAIALGREEPNLSPTANAMMMLIHPQIQRDIEKWIDIRNKRQEIGRMGGVAKATNCYQKLPNDSKSKQNLPNDSKSKQNLANDSKSKQNLANDSKSKQNLANEGVNVNVNDNVDVDNNSVILEEKDSKEKEIEEFIERIYKMYPTRCPIRDNISLGKCAKDKKRIEGLLKRYSMEDIERVVKKEVEDKLGKHPLKNFSTFLNNFPDPNDLFSKKNMGYPQSIDDLKEDDVQDRLIYFNDWIEKAAPKVCDGILGGRPENEQQYQHLINHTIGGAKGLCYVVLVFQRDGWEDYYDERGFMFTYSNYIKANGLFKE